VKHKTGNIYLQTWSCW